MGVFSFCHDVCHRTNGFHCLSSDWPGCIMKWQSRARLMPFSHGKPHRGAYVGTGRTQCLGCSLFHCLNLFIPLLLRAKYRQQHPLCAVQLCNIELHTFETEFWICNTQTQACQYQLKKSTKSALKPHSLFFPPQALTSHTGVLHTSWVFYFSLCHKTLLQAWLVYFLSIQASSIRDSRGLGNASQSWNFSLRKVWQTLWQPSN